MFGNLETDSHSHCTISRVSTTTTTTTTTTKVDATGFMVNGSAVTLLPTVTCLGVVVDQEMLFGDHVRRLASLCFYWLRQLRSIRRTLTTETTTILVHALVISRIDYCNGYWLAPTTFICVSFKQSSTLQQG